MASIKTRCDARFHARNHGGTRPASVINSVVIHCTGNDSHADSTALYFQTSPDAGSTQLVVDDVKCDRTLDDLVIPFGAPPLNTNANHVEIEGPETWKRGQWLLPKHRRRLRRAAYRAARWCKDYQIPVHIVTKPADLPNDPAAFHGVTYHFVVSAKWHQSTHKDPGKGFPYRYVAWKIRRYRKAL